MYNVESYVTRRFVEYQKDNSNISITQTSMEHCVYIYKCENSVIQVKNKINSIILDSCKKTAVVFDSLVSALEVVNCQSCQAQVTLPLTNNSLFRIRFIISEIRSI